MAGHKLQRRQILAEQLRGALGAILMIDSVKSVAANSFRQPFIRSGIDERGSGQVAVKAGVEHGDLRDGSKSLFDDVDSFELGAIMQRRKRGHAARLRLSLPA